MAKIIEKLNPLRKKARNPMTQGLADSYITSLAAADPLLEQAVDQALVQNQQWQEDYPQIAQLGEQMQIETLLDGYLNFYEAAAINPYVPLAARGPWIITTQGAVIHDSGGYGMLGFGQNHPKITAQLNRDQVMANVMTASLSQYSFMKKLKDEIGHRRSGALRNPFDQFVCMNSGSEAMTVALRITDAYAKIMTDPDGPHAHKKIALISNIGSFHGRTDRPAQASHNSAKKYAQLASFRGRDSLITSRPNDLESLQNTFDQARSQGYYIEAMLIEPVMGEGNPGVAMTPEYFALAQRLVQNQDGFLIADSIQAGLRTYGCLSICDYPGFETLPAPDMESYSKALNAGQFPLSVLALTNRAAQSYKTGYYGNTMTTNPRALDVATAVLDLVDDKLRRNIQERGQELVQKLQNLAQKIPDAITSVHGTGLLLAAELNPQKYKVVGNPSVEVYLRQKGIGVIHGGQNALRFTPHFNLSSLEVDMIIDHIEDALLNGPRLA